MNRRVIVRDIAEQTEQSGFAILVITKFEGFDLFRVAVAKRMMSIIEVGTVPGDAVVIKPGSAKLRPRSFCRDCLWIGD